MNLSVTYKAVKEHPTKIQANFYLIPAFHQNQKLKVLVLDLLEP